MSMDGYVCIDCGARQPDEGNCRACGNELTSKLGDERIRELMRDVELRLSLKRAGQFRMIGVVFGMAVIFACWTQSWYWDLRGKLYPGIPFLIDQWVFMALLGLGLSKLLEKRFTKRRFPYLNDDLTLTTP